MRKKAKHSSSSSSSNKDLVQEREELMVHPSENRTSNTKDRKRTKLSLPAMEDLVEEREDLMVFPSSSVKTHLLKPCFTSQASLPRPDLKALSLSVSFNGWRFSNVKFMSWATKMLTLHEPTWKKAGILEAVAASTLKICKDSDLILGIAERWCPDTKTFVFPWGEATITLEDVMVLLGFSVLGSPYFAALDSSGEEVKAKLEKEWVKIKKDKVNFTQVKWMGRFMDSGDDELEHVAFLVLWLSYFVFPSRYYHIEKAILPIVVHLSSGLDMGEIQGTKAYKHTNPLLKGELRLSRWDNMGQGDNDVREILDNSKMDSFEWRPYTKALKNWEVPKFYPEKAMWVPVGPDLDDEFISFARCIKVSELVGMNCREHYFPNRVASQFGLLQDVPCPVNKNNLSEEEAWSEYNKPIEDLTLFIPSRSATPRVTSMFCDWWRKWFPQLQRSLKEKSVVESSKNIIGDGYDDTFASGSRKRTRRKRFCTMGCCQTHDSYDEELCLTIAQISRLSIKKCSDVTCGGEDSSEPLGKKSRFEQGSEVNDETGSKTGKIIIRSPLDENNSSETRQTCDDELDVHGSNVKKMSMLNDGNKEPECLLHEDGGMAGEKKEDDSLIQKKLHQMQTTMKQTLFKILLLETLK